MAVGVTERTTMSPRGGVNRLFKLFMDLSIFGCGNKLSVYLSSTNPQYTRLN